MWQLICKESWAPKNWCFWTVVLEKTLENPLDCKEINSVMIASLTQFSCSVVSDSCVQHTRLPCPSPSPGAHLNSCPPCWWCHSTISSSATSFSFCLQSFPVSGSFPVSWLFTSGSQSIGASALTSVLPMNIQDWFSLGWTDWISLPSKGFSRVFSSTTVWKHQFFGVQPSFMVQLSHVYTTTRKTRTFTIWTFVGKVMSLLFNKLV